MSKRKGTDYLTATASSFVSYSNDTTNNDDDWLDTRQKLKEFRTSFSMDDLLVSLDDCVTIHQNLQQEQSSLLVTSQSLKNQLEDRIEMAREACKKESNDLYHLQLSLDQSLAEKQALLDSLDDLDNMQRDVHDTILQHKETASQFIEEMDQVEAERMRQVPRLKQQISLYATCTNIKWDFHQEDVLAGQVAVQPKGGIRRFSIDPTEYSDFEITNHLWSLMETGTYAAEITNE